MSDGGHSPSPSPTAVADALRRAGFLRPDDEAEALVARAAGDADLLGALVARRCGGEPLAWLLGSVRFCGHDLEVHPGVYVPRPHTEQVARRALAHLPASGVAVDLCTGCGAIAALLTRSRPQATVVASDVDPAAVACARANGVDAWCGDLFAPIDPAVRGRVDVVAGVVPYVPTAALGHLQRDTLTFESTTAYDGGPDGLDLLRRVAREAAGWLRPGGVLVLELGGDQADLLDPVLVAAGYVATERVVDDDGDERAVVATWTG